MAYIVNNKPIKQVSVLTEPNSYQTDVRPEDMQSGSTCVSKGVIVTGTGRAFEFASYGQTSLYGVMDRNGNEKFGIMIPEPMASNVLFISVGSDSDFLSQETHVINVNDGVVAKIGENHTTKAGVYAYYSDGFLYIYIDGLSSIDTVLNYFEGKDNLI